MTVPIFQWLYIKKSDREQIDSDNFINRHILHFKLHNNYYLFRLYETFKLSEQLF